MMDDSTLSVDDFERIDCAGGRGARVRSESGEGTEETSLRSSTRSSVSRSSGSGSGDGGSFVGEVDTGPSESDLLRIMECPVCAEFPIPPIYNCCNGHFTCNECISLLSTCSLCEAKFTQVRNYALESIIESTKFRCRYNQQGCKERINGAEYRSHLDVCAYGPAICNEQKFTQCEDKVIERVNYVDHLYLCHNAKGVKFGDPLKVKSLVATFLQSKGDDFSPLYLTSTSTGQTFFVFTKKYKSFYCWWVASFKPEDAETAIAKLTWSAKDKFALTKTDENLTGDRFEEDETQNSGQASTELMNPYGLQWTLPIHSLKKPFTEIRDSGLCAVLPDTHMQPFSKTKIVTSSGEEQTPEVEWNLTVEVVSSNKDNESNKPDKPFNILESEVDWQKWLEKLRLIFPLLTLMFMIVGIGLLAAIYIQTSSSSFPSTSEEIRQKNEHQGYSNGKQKPADMKPYPHLNDRQEDGDFEGYRGFYYNRDKIPRNSPDDYNRDKGNYESWKNWKKVEKNKRRKVVYGSGAPEHDDEFVGYRGFYHQKTLEGNSQQNQDNQEQQIPIDNFNFIKPIGSNLIKKLVNFTADQVAKFFGINSVKEDKKASEEVPKPTKSMFGVKIEGLDFVGAIVAKLFFLTFCLFCLITALVSLTMYRRWIYSVPPGIRRTRRTRSTGSDSNGETDPSEPEDNFQSRNSDNSARRRLI